jgi:RNA polymerase sigma-70 factor (ECF subfamily)
MQSTAVPNTENTSVSDNDLIKLAKAGDESGFEQLILRYQDRLFRAIANDVGCQFTAEDIVQEAFVKAFLRLDSFQQQSKFYTWLYRIAINLRITHYRKNSRPVFSLETVDQSRITQRSDPDGSPDDIAVRSEAREQVRAALNKLADQHRRILILRDYEQFDYQTISEILEIQLGTVRSRLHRARSALRNELKRQRIAPLRVQAAAAKTNRRSAAPRQPGQDAGFSRPSNTKRTSQPVLAVV